MFCKSGREFYSTNRSKANFAGYEQNVYRQIRSREEAESCCLGPGVRGLVRL